jgi:hypothetical protein
LNSALMREPLLRAQDLSDEQALADAQATMRGGAGARARGCSLFFRGKFDPGWVCFCRAIALWEVDKARAEIPVYGEDPSVLCRAYGAWLQWSLGYPDASSALMCRALTDAERLSNGHILAFTLASHPHITYFERIPSGDRARRCVIGDLRRARISAVGGLCHDP